MVLLYLSTGTLISAIAHQKGTQFFDSLRFLVILQNTVGPVFV
jgi:hypothetical protein